MSAPGVSIQETAATTLSVRAAATALPVFVGTFKTKNDSDGLKAGQCIKINDWLSFAQRFSHDVSAEVSFTATPSGKKNAKNKINGKSVTVQPLCSVFEGEACQIDVNLSDIEEGAKLYIQLHKADTGYCQKPVSILCQPGNERFSLDFVSNNPPEAISHFIPLPVGTTACTLTLDTVFDLDTNPEQFFVNLALNREPGPEDYEAQCRVLIQPVNGKVDSKANYNLSYYAIQHYFQNGGGPCYLLPLLKGDEPELAALPAVIQTHAADATLLVCADADAAIQAKVYASLNPLLTGQQGFFLIADSKTTAESPNTVADQTASYYPGLRTDYRARPADADTKINGYTTAQGQALDSLAELKTINPGAYDFAVQALEDKLGGAFLTLPASAAVAGCYARNDRERGVWKAPANIELHGVQAPSVVVTNEDQDGMNAKGINAIRAFNGRGTLIWGTRTLDVDGDDWRYIPVRRLFNSVERDIKKSVQAMVFEPNNQATWERVRGAIDNYLRTLWRQGALLGDSESEAYFVKVGKDVTMDQQDIQQGKMIIEVGMAAVRPAEFIVLQVSQKMQ